MADLSGYKLTGGDTPFATGDPRTFPAGYNDIIDEVMRLDTVKAETTTTDALASDIADRVLKSGDTMTGILTLEAANPQIDFLETDWTSRYFLYISNGNFHVLLDRDGDGTWETPHPIRVHDTREEVAIWVGTGGVPTTIRSSGLMDTDRIHVNEGSNATPAYSFVNRGDSGFYTIGDNPQVSVQGVRVFHMSNGLITGIGDNQHNLGTSSHRWTAVYAVDGTIRTSDASEKSDVRDSDLGLDFINRLRTVRWRWNWGNRPHYGLIAQNVRQTLDDMGVTDFAGYIDPSVDWEYNPDDPVLSGEEPGPLGLRYEEFIGPIIRAVQELSDRLDAVESPSGRQ